MALLLVCGLLSGCGTNVRWLLTEQGELTPEADRLATAAEGLGGGMEQTVYDANGQLLTGSFMDYAMPRADDVPDLVCGFDESTPTGFTDKKRTTTHGRRVRVKHEITGEKISDTEWTGTAQRKIRANGHVSGNDSLRCKTGEIEWSATLVS